MTENEGVFLKKIFGLCNIYLGFFIVLGIVASMYIGVTNYKLHEILFNKTLGACLFVVIVTAVLLFLPMKIRINLALTHFSVFLGLFLINALLEIPFSDLRVKAKLAGISWDARNKYQAVRDSRKEGINAYPAAFFPAFAGRKAFFDKNFDLDFEHHIFPLSGIAKVKTFICNETGKWVSPTSDRYGYNNDDSVYQNTRNSVVIVGDSFAAGQCVERGDDIAGNLRRRGYTAITLGTGGNGPLGELATLKEYGPVLTPKIILWLYFEGNDFVTDLPAEFHFQPLKRYLDKGYTQNLALKQDQIDQFWVHFFRGAEEYLKGETTGNVFWDNGRTENIRVLILRLVTFHNIREYFGFSRNSYCPAYEVFFDDDEKMFRTVMKAALQEAESLNSKLYFVYLPTFPSLFNERSSAAFGSQRVRKVISELGIPLIDFYACLKNSGDPAGFFPLRSGGHYNPKGYNLLADLVEAKALQAIKK